MDNDIRNQVIKHLESLPERDRQILCLIYYESLTHKEAALLLNIEVEDVEKVDENTRLTLTTTVKV